LDRRAVVTAAAAFVVGCLPLIVYNLSWPPRTLQPALKGTLHQAGGNAAGGPIDQLHGRFSQLVKLLDGRNVADLFWAGHGAFPLVPLLVLVAALWVVLRYARPASRAATRGPMFLLLCGLVILVASAVTPGGSYPHHVLLVYPFPQLVVAAAACDAVGLVRGGGRGVVAATAAAAAVAAALALDVAATTHTLSVLDRTGGQGTFSDGIYRLERDLSKHPSQRTLVLDWGIYQNVMGLSQGRLHAEELWQPLNDERPRGSALAKLAQPGVRYVLHAPAATQFQRPRDRFFATAGAAGLRPRLEEAITDRRGHPLYEVYRLAG
jgi:hypothetical protein